MAKPLLINLVLALSWAAITADLTATNLLFGFAVGLVIIVIASPLLGSPAYALRLWFAIELAALTIWRLVTSSLQITADVLSPKHRMKSGVIAVPIELESDLQIAIFGGLVSLTPGTLALDVSDDRRLLFLHVMHIKDEDVEAVQRRLQHRVQRRIRRVFG